MAEPAERVVEVDVESGETVERPLTEAELAELAELRDRAEAEAAADVRVGENEATVHDRLEQARARLTADVAAITAAPPTLFGGLTANERRFLATLARVELGLIRLALRDLDALDE